LGAPDPRGSAWTLCARRVMRSSKQASTPHTTHHTPHTKVRARFWIHPPLRTHTACTCILWQGRLRPLYSSISFLSTHQTPHIHNKPHRALHTTLSTTNHSHHTPRTTHTTHHRLRRAGGSQAPPPPRVWAVRSEGCPVPTGREQSRSRLSEVTCETQASSGPGRGRAVVPRGSPRRWPPGQGGPRAGVKEENTAAAEWHRRRRNWARRQRRKRRVGQGQQSGASAPPTAQAATLEQRVGGGRGLLTAL